jgi:hypothetical protein
MPPNFPEFAERMEASLSEVSEAGASNPSLQEKKEPSSALTESSGHLDHREPQSELVTLEHVSRSVGIPEIQDVKNLIGDCQDFRFQQHSESSPHEFQPLESEAAASSGNTDEMQEHRFSSATWPRAMKSSAKGGFSEKQHHVGDTVCTVEMPPLSPCLSEELLDPEMHILITPNLREKTESELKFEEDERWIMMEGEEEWEEDKLSERGKTLLMADEKNSLADIFEERELANTVTVVEDGADCLVAVLETLDHVPIGQICCSNDPPPVRDQLTSVPKDTPLDCCVLAGEGAVGDVENRTAQGSQGLVSELECIFGPVDAEQLSDTDSVQMFLELEKECLYEGVTPLVELQSQASYEGLAPSQDAENSLVISHFPGATLEKEQHKDLLKVTDLNTGLDCKYFNVLDSSQVPNAKELIAYSDNMRDMSMVSKEFEKVPFSPKTGGKFKSPADLELLGELDTGGLLNSEHRASCEEKLSVFITSELAKENGNLSQIDCSQTEGNVEECIERVPLNFAFNSELKDVISGPEVEVLVSDTNLLTDEIHLESEKGAINQEYNSLTSLGNVDPCELSMEKVYNKDGEAKELYCQANLLRNGTPVHFHRDFPKRDFPKQVFQDFQKKSPESEVLSLHLLSGELRYSRDGMETMNDLKPRPNMASSQGEEVETRDSNSTMNVFTEEQFTKASNTKPVLEGWIPNQQKPTPTAAVLIAEDALDASVPTLEEDIPVVAVPAPEESAASAAAIGFFQEEDIPVPSVATIETHIPAAAVSASEGAAASAVVDPAPKGTVLVAAVSSPVGTAPAAAVAITEEEASAVVGSSPEKTTPAVAVPIVQEDDTPKGLATPAATASAPHLAGLTILEEPATVDLAGPTALEVPAIPKETASPDLAGPTAPELLAIPVEPATPDFERPTVPEELATPSLPGPATPEEPTTADLAGPTALKVLAILDLAGSTTLEESVYPAAAVPTSEEPGPPTHTASTPEEPAAPATVGPTPKEPETVAASVSTAEVPAMEEVFTPSEPFLGGTAHADSMPVSEEAAPVLEEVSPTGMWVKEDLDSSAFGIKEVTDTVLHGKVSLAANDGFSSNEVIVAHFVAWKGLESK